MPDFDDDDYSFEMPEPRKPFWRCESCGYESHTKAMPTDRAKFYNRVARTSSPLCPKCRSESFMPVGF